MGVARGRLTLYHNVVYVLNDFHTVASFSDGNMLWECLFLLLLPLSTSMTGWWGAFFRHPEDDSSKKFSTIFTLSWFKTRERGAF